MQMPEKEMKCIVVLITFCFNYEVNTDPRFYYNNDTTNRFPWSLFLDKRNTRLACLKLYGV